MVLVHKLVDLSYRQIYHLMASILNEVLLDSEVRRIGA